MLVETYPVLTKMTDLCGNRDFVVKISFFYLNLLLIYDNGKVICNRDYVKFEADFEHICNIAGFQIIWHYGWAPEAYSYLILRVPQEEVTLILLANSDGASAPFRLDAGNVLTSPFGVMFLKLFTNLMEPY